MEKGFLPRPVGTGKGAMVLNWKRVGFDIRKKFFMRRAERHWKRLPREAVDAPWLELFNCSWTGLWATCSSGRCSCPWQGGWTRSLKVPSNPNYSVILRWKEIFSPTNRHPWTSHCTNPVLQLHQDWHKHGSALWRLLVRALPTVTHQLDSYH